jgi:hypothetical protein
MLLPALTTPLPDTALFDQLLLFPMKFGVGRAGVNGDESSVQ